MVALYIYSLMNYSNSEGAGPPYILLLIKVITISLCGSSVHCNHRSVEWVSMVSNDRVINTVRANGAQETSM